MSLRIAIVGAIAASALVRPARASSRCEDDHLRAQERRASGALVDARDALLRCSAAACPSLVQQDCVEWLGQVEAELPTIVLDARDASGASIPARAQLDGEPLARALDGKAITLDPGEHEVVFTSAPRAPVTVRILAKVGEKNQPVVATFQRPPSVDTKTPAFVLFGVAAASLVTFATLAIAGQVEFDGFDTCKPRCDPSDVDRVEREFVAADVMIGVTAAALGTGVVLWIALPSRAPTAAAWGVRGTF